MTATHNLQALHTFAGIGYQLDVGLAADAHDTWHIWYHGDAATLEGFGPYSTQAEAIAAAANMVLADLSDETGEPQGHLKVAR